MKKPSLSSISKTIKVGAAKHAPEILLGIGVTGMVSTTVLAVRATPKAIILIEEQKKELKTDELTAVETIKTTWKCYIPATVTCGVSIACLIGSCSVNSRRNAALATAYSLSEAALVEYKEKVIETLGEKKEKHIREKIDKDKVDKNPVHANNVIVTGKGETLCYDGVFGRYFKSDIDKIKKAENTINRQLVVNDYISLNDFYDELGLERIDIGDDLGWKVGDGLLNIEFSSQIATDGTPCLVIEYNSAPKYGYANYS